MKPPVPHKEALRQLIADLAMQPDAHIANVLRGLAPNRRRIVQSLLGEAQTSAESAHAGAGLSPWLAERLAPWPGFAMTERAAEALRHAAASASKAPTAPEANRPSLLSRLTSRKTAGDAL